MIKKLKENKKIIIIAVFIIGASLAWWQSRDVEETPVNPIIEKECVKE